MELPDVYQADLDDAALVALADQLHTGARVLDVLIKGGVTQRTDGQGVTLSEAVQALRQGEISGVQVRYLFDEGEWRDTLMRTATGYRVVRMRTHDE